MNRCFELLLNQFMPGILYFSRALVRVYFQWKFGKNLDNHINASFIDISRIKCLVFYCGRLSSAQLDRWQAPKQRPIIYRHPVEQIAYRRDIKDNGYKSVFTNSWLIRQRNRLWIKGWGNNRQKSELIHWRQCLLSGTTEPCPLGLRETLACIHVIPHNVTPCVACWHGSRPN